MIKSIFLFIAIITIVVLFTSCSKKKKKTSTALPNIVFIMSDDHGYQTISAYGHNLNNTPYIDNLAEEGMRFDNAYVNNSLCAPSRASILSGKYSGNSSVKKIGDIFDGSQTTFPKQLQTAGYQTAFIGKWHLKSMPTGFDYWNILPGQGDYYQPQFINEKDTIQVDGYVTNIITDDALNWLDQREEDKPFAVLIWGKAPHRNWMPEIKYLNKFDSIQIPEPETLFDDYETRTKAVHEQKLEISKWLADNYDLKLNMYPDGESRYDDLWERFFSRLTKEEQQEFEEAYKAKNASFYSSDLKGDDLIRWKYQRFMKDYLRTVQTIDDNVGRVMKYLKENNLDENTIVIYTSDQGFFLGEHGWFDKRFMYKESFRTPLIIRWPNQIKAGSINDDFVMNLDIGQTILDAAGAEIPKDMEGRSFLPILKGDTPDDWRKNIYYQYYASGGETNVAKHIGVQSKDHKLIYFYENKDWELYDLKKDSKELYNVYGKPEYEEVQKKLKENLIEKAQKYDEDIKIKE